MCESIVVSLCYSTILQPSGYWKCDACNGALQSKYYGVFLKFSMYNIMNKINVVGKVNIDNNVTNERVVTTVLMNQVHVCIYYILEDNRTLG